MNQPPDDEVPTLLLLADGDDVVIATTDLEPGVHRTSNGSAIELLEPVRLGHKVAARPLDLGERVQRAGVPIGSMTAMTARGAWVHTHNLGSDYIETYAQRGGTR